MMKKLLSLIGLDKDPNLEFRGCLGCGLTVFHVVHSRMSVNSHLSRINVVLIIRSSNTHTEILSDQTEVPCHFIFEIRNVAWGANLQVGC